MRIENIIELFVTLTKFALFRKFTHAAITDVCTSPLSNMNMKLYRNCETFQAFRVYRSNVWSASKNNRKNILRGFKWWPWKMVSSLGANFSFLIQEVIRWVFIYLNIWNFVANQSSPMTHWWIKLKKFVNKI